MANKNDTGEILLYQTADGLTKIEVNLVNDTVWLTLDQMAMLFQRNKSTISRHVKDAFESGELIPDSTVAFFATVQNEGGRKVSRDLAYYNLDMIISVGYRVHSLRGVQFRMWATRTLKEYLIKGFAMNDELLKRAGGEVGRKILHFALRQAQGEFQNDSPLPFRGTRCHSEAGSPAEESISPLPYSVTGRTDWP